jgi:hypothetical protein
MKVVFPFCWPTSFFNLLPINQISNIFHSSDRMLIMNYAYPLSWSPALLKACIVSCLPDLPSSSWHRIAGSSYVTATSESRSRAACMVRTLLPPIKNMP